MKITEIAYGKINLGLDVLGVRPDKYHEVAMVMQSVGLTDEITIADHETLEVTTDNSHLAGGPANLAWKAAELMGQVAGRKPLVSIHIQKRIFLAAGLAGGSTDAAAVLRGSESFLESEFTFRKIRKIGS
jgi:4-diphosphocytidyl-2-C-methyl-D-erythritol kinase